MIKNKVYQTEKSNKEILIISGMDWYKASLTSLIPLTISNNFKGLKYLKYKVIFKWGI